MTRKEMTMRWSEMEKVVRKELEHRVGGDNLTASLAIFKVAAEAAGVVWEPEEEPLPEKLEKVGRIVLAGGAAPYFDAEMQIATAIRLPEDKKNSDWHEAVLREMVRRYNAWPGLERLADNLCGALSVRGGIAAIHADLAKILEPGK